MIMTKHRAQVWIVATIACLSLLARVDRTQAGERALTPDVALAYDRMGPTTNATVPLVVVNGGPGLTHAYMVQNDVWSRLSRTRSVVFYDQRGLGRSVLRRADAPQTLPAQVADLDAVRQALGAPRIDILGDSFGGLIALAYTLAHPDHVRRLVISDGVPALEGMVHPLPDTFPDLDAATDAQARGLGAQAAADLRLRTHMRECFYNPDLASRYLAGFPGLTVSPDIADRMWHSAEAVDLGLQLHRITAPTLILTGRFDLNVAVVTAWRMAKAIPGAGFHVFERSGHLPAYEEPDAYVATLDAFLTFKPATR
ncbi:MAG: alpha/beta fold hydrolase [Janthinobacterium lividum]